MPPSPTHTRVPPPCAPLRACQIPGRKVKKALTYIRSLRARVGVETVGSGPSSAASSSRSSSSNSSHSHSGGIFVDLGSGDGEAVLQAASLGYQCRGVELNFTMWAISQVRLFTSLKLVGEWRLLLRILIAV